MKPGSRHLPILLAVAAAAAAGTAALLLLADLGGSVSGPRSDPAAGGPADASLGGAPAPDGFGAALPLPPGALPRGPRGAVEGFVLDPGGNPAAGSGVRATGAAGGRTWSASARTGRDGAYRLELPSGRAAVRARSRRFLDSPESEVEIPAGGTVRADLRLADRLPLPVRVVGPDGIRPLAGAILRLTRPGTGEVFTASEGPGGGLLLPALPRGDYRVEAEAPGFAIGPETARTLSVSGPSSEVRIRLHVSSRIAGTVRDERGRPLGGAEIRAFTRASPAGRACSGGDGAYVLEVLPGRVRILALHTDRAPVFGGELQAPEGGTSTLDIEMGPGAVLRGRVAGPGGAPLPGAVVRAQWMSPIQGFTHFVPEVSAGKDGEYRVEHLAAGDHAVSARAEGFAPASRAVRMPGAGREAESDFLLGGGFALEGRILDPGGEGLPGARAEIQGGGGSVAAGADGCWRIEGLPRGTADLAFTAEGRVPAFRSGVAVPGTALPVPLPRMGSLRGRVEFEDTGQEGVEVIAAAAGGLRFRTWTDSGGGFAFREVPPGSYALEASAEGFYGKAGPFEVPEGGEAAGSVVLVPFREAG
jgi:protocatechuate 3,4-dioxygenase beta subunit